MNIKPSPPTTSNIHNQPHTKPHAGTGLLKKELPGLQSMIAADSGAKADRHFKDGDKIA